MLASGMVGYPNRLPVICLVTSVCKTDPAPGSALGRKARSFKRAAKVAELITWNYILTKRLGPQFYLYGLGCDIICHTCPSSMGSSLFKKMGGGFPDVKTLVVPDKTWIAQCSRTRFSPFWTSHVIAIRRRYGS